jgi:hypothetical protein
MNILKININLNKSFADVVFFFFFLSFFVN